MIDELLPAFLSVLSFEFSVFRNSAFLGICPLRWSALVCVSLFDRASLRFSAFACVFLRLFVPSSLTDISHWLLTSAFSRIRVPSRPLAGFQLVKIV